MNGNGRDDRLKGIVGLAAANGGWFGGLCVSGFSATQLILTLLPAQLPGQEPTRLTAALTYGSYFFFGLALVSLSLKRKADSDLFVKREAEKSIFNKELPTGSTVPAIQQEIKKQLIDLGATPAEVEKIAVVPHIVNGERK